MTDYQKVLEFDLDGDGFLIQEELSIIRKEEAALKAASWGAMR